MHKHLRRSYDWTVDTAGRLACGDGVRRLIYKFAMPVLHGASAALPCSCRMRLARVLH